MSFLVGMLSGLDEARKAEYARQTAEQERNQQLEFNILSQLAQGRRARGGGCSVDTDRASVI